MISGLASALLSIAVLGAPSGMVRVGPGEAKPLYVGRNEAPRTVHAFLLDCHAVTNAELLAFVKRNPSWRRDRVSPLFADASYLASWRSPEALGAGAPADAPAVHVSWFLARAYCDARGARLPTEDEWELAAAADETRFDARDDLKFTERILSWYGQPTPDVLPAVARSKPNRWGVFDLHGLILGVGGRLRQHAGGGHGGGVRRRRGDHRRQARLRGVHALRVSQLPRGPLHHREPGLPLRQESGDAMKHLALIAALFTAGVAHASPPADSIYTLKMSLVDQDGRPATLDQFRGHPVLVTMFYGSCPQACPLLITKMKLFEQSLSPEARADLRVMLVSIDPQRDTPEALKQLARAHHVDETRWRFLRTSDDSVRELAAVLGIKYHRLNDGAFWHSSVIVVLDREGRIAGKTEGLALELAPVKASLDAVR